ncbi:MAG: iron complex transport system permease protein [Candidatus Kentron sp. G]|nr:MAG: iron complex transport system permease protein [Candidatus Kentron sp. G]VFN00173.1 MAG: iron complex transport system permease protein [Candidatus Kentron sp. G]VFN01808.1 MAG: iron complex transport system permease protein [Candidatus Kentron sp. G]
MKFGSEKAASIGNNGFTEYTQAHPLLVGAITIGLLLTVMSISISVGPAAIGWGEVFSLLRNALFQPLAEVGSDIDPIGADTWQKTIVWELRLPRVICAALVGAALALSGAILQGLFRNPLASPSVLGVSSGATLGAVMAIFFGLAATIAWILPIFAFAGALVTLFVVYAIATQRGRTPITTLLLSGIAVNAFNIAMSSFVLALAMDSWEVGRTIVYWTMGGLDGRTWDHVLLIAPVLLAGLAVILAYERDLDALLMGEIHAAAVGVDVTRVRIILLICAAVLTGVAVAISGGIAFIGLVVPHIVRLLAGPHHRALLPLSALGGALILVAADLLLRGLFQEHNIPLGVVTAAMGAPFFLFLLLRQQDSTRAS